MTAPPIAIRPLAPADAAWTIEAFSSVWGRPFVVSRGRGHRVDRLSGLVAERDGARVGLLTHRIDGAEMEVVTLQAFAPRTGAGTALLRAACGVARTAACRRVWLVTTNDNTGAIAFYRAVGMALAAVHAGALVESRRLKPEIPLVGEGGVPIADELEFEIPL